MEERYNRRLRDYSYDFRCNLLSMPLRLKSQILDVNVLKGEVTIEIETIPEKIVVSVKDRNNIYIKYPQDLINSYKDGKFISIIILHMICDFCDLCKKFKLFKSENIKVNDVKNKYELEINPTGVVLYEKNKEENNNICDFLYEDYLLYRKRPKIITASKSETKLLKSLKFWVNECPKWLSSEVYTKKMYKSARFS